MKLKLSLNLFIRCCICECYHDNHLMVQCDTCSNRYHITCLDPPLTRVPKKTSKCGWYVTLHYINNHQVTFSRQCEECCFDSEDELKPSVAKDNEPTSRFGRKLNHPRLTSWGLTSVSTFKLVKPVLQVMFIGFYY